MGADNNGWGRTIFGERLADRRIGGSVDGKVVLGMTVLRMTVLGVCCDVPGLVFPLRYNERMPYRTEQAPHAAAALAAVRRVAAASVAAGHVPVVIVPDAAAVARVRGVFAGEGPSLGVRIETAQAWVEDRWELFGDGRRLPSPVERALLVARAVREDTAAGGVLEVTPGTIDMLALLARGVLPALLTADVDGVGLNEAERAVVSALTRYSHMLDGLGLCELSQAAALLPELMKNVPPLVLWGFDGLDPFEELLVQGMAQVGDVLRVEDVCDMPDNALRAPELAGLIARLPSPGLLGPLVPTGAVRFLLPAGRYAAPELVADEVACAVLYERKAASDGKRPALPVVVAARDALVWFEDIAGRLARRGIAAAVSASVPFSDTAFGRAFLALVRLVQGEGDAPALAADFVLSPFSGVSQRRAYELDATWRGDRTLDGNEVARQLAAASDAAANALSALVAGDTDGALAGFEARLASRGDVDAAWRALQLAAVGRARRIVAEATHVRASFEEALALLESASVPAGEAACVSRMDDDRPEVLVMTVSDAAAQPSCSSSQLVLCDMTADAYPVRQPEDAATLLLEKLGFTPKVDPLTTARRCLIRAVSGARDSVVCERVLNTLDADAAYPAVMLEELADCYRADATDEVDLDRATGLPRPLVPFARTLGEDGLHCILSESGGAPDAGGWWPVPVDGEVSDAFRPLVVLAAGAVQPGSGQAVQLSASALESYLECPGKWFAQRRLRLSEPDAGFGPLEMGSFSHSVLRSFYVHFREAGQPKVTEANLPAARALMRQTFNRHLEFQRELKHGQNPLVPCTKMEEAEAAELGRRLEGFLDREAQLLPGFIPTYFEFAFGTTESFPYAGALLRGSIDRIDVNGRGQAVVIDYKGSVGRGYALSSASPAPQAGGAWLPHKVQALVYAQVARRLLGLDVVGALYVSYGRDGRVTGAFDRTVLGEGDIPGIDARACGAPGDAYDGPFGQLVDEVEQAVAEAVRTLTDGGIGPCPRGEDPCGFCPVLSCGRREDR